MNNYRYTDNTKQHLHEIFKDGNWHPLIGTSSVSEVLAKPLTWWASGLACAKFGWINKKDEDGKFRTNISRLAHARARKETICNMEDEAYLSLLDEAYKAHSEKLDSSADAGNDLHALVEEYIKRCMKDGAVLYTGAVQIQPFIDWAVRNVKRFLWSEGHCYSEKLWTGGISDAGFEDKDGKYVILDVKSSKAAYLSQFWQCAGYDTAISENGVLDAEGNVLFKLDKPIEYYVIFPFGMKEPSAQINLDVTGGRAAFEAEVFLYKKLNT